MPNNSLNSINELQNNKDLQCCLLKNQEIQKIIDELPDKCLQSINDDVIYKDLQCSIRTG
jgi:hypothetical protein